MRKRLWRLSSAFAVFAFVTFAIFGGANSAYASEHEANCFYMTKGDITSPTHMEDINVAAGQSYSYDVAGAMWMTGNNIQEAWMEVQNYLQDQSHVLFESTNSKVASVSFDKNENVWKLKVNGASAGEATVTASFRYTAESGEVYKASSSIRVTVSGKANKIKALKVEIWGVTSADDASNLVASMAYVDKCPVCGESHYGTVSGQIIYEFEDSSNLPSVYPTVTAGTCNVASVKLEQAQLSTSGQGSSSQKQVIQTFTIEGNALGKDAFTFKVDGQQVESRQITVSVKKSDPSYVEGGSRTMLKGDTRNFEWLARLTPNEGLNLCQYLHSDSFPGNISYDIIDGGELVEKGDSEYANSLTALKAGKFTVRATDDLKGVHDMDVVIVDPDTIDTSKFGFAKKEWTIRTNFDDADPYASALLLDAHNEQEPATYPTVFNQAAVDFLHQFGGGESEFGDSKFSFKLDPEVSDVAAVMSRLEGIGAYRHYLVPKGYGTVKVQLYYGDALCDTMTLKVVPDSGEDPSANPAQKVELSKTSLSFTVGDASEKLTAKVSPSDADDTTVTWTSSDPFVATVKDGVVTPLKAGAATITATCGDKTATCTVNVAERAIAGVAGSDGSDVKVSAENNAAAELVQSGSISLVVEEPTALSDAAKATIAGLEQGSTKVAETLEIKLLKNGEVIEDYDGSASFVVRVKMTAAMKALTNLKVLYVGEDGATETMDTWVEGDYLCFRTTHFSTYVVTGDQSAQPAGPSQPAQPTQTTVTTTKTTKVAKKASRDALANTGDRAMAAAAVVAMAGLILVAAAAMHKSFDI